MGKICLLLPVLLLATFQAAGDDNFDLSRAAFSGDAEKVQALLAAGADVDSWSNLGSHSHTPLMYAIYAGHTEIAGILLEAGADINTAHSITHTVLYHALESNRLRAETMQFLVDAGVGMDHTPLHWAMENRYCRETATVMAILVAAGVDLNARDALGFTALMKAAAEGRDQIVAILLDAGADVDAVMKASGRTALACAVEAKQTEVVRLLIAVGADLEPLDKWGNTPLMRARNKDFEEIVRLLTDAGASR